ncbi:DUF4168 domain-containing protein [Salegentibacter sp. LM13S]|uniref:DUF4168 domain-containing protein n=1 Tax=Salegentibacter lacus TaxID=2873599 RepID=UPI001CCBBB75|nr:DUF4168 domain-containing protein [Salegentibacter lacus]MBZ9630245.1 DUF4168 domain-containing protein [Salegentibacter lacus]
MIKSKKIAGLLFAFALGTAGVVAQTQQLPQQQQQTVEVDVSDEELSNFADAYQKIRMVNQQAQQEMAKKVEDSGFDIQRFNEIHQASLDPNAEVDVTEEEKTKHAEVVAEIEGMQGEFQKEMESAISEEGLDVARYEKIAMALQTDTELQQRLQQLMQG